MSSVDEIVNAVRVESRRRQRGHVEPGNKLGAEPSGVAAFGTTMDRRTIARTLALLEHSLQKVYTRDFTGGLETPPVTLVLLSENAGAEQQLACDYFARQHEQCNTGLPSKGPGGSRQGQRRLDGLLFDTSSESEVGEFGGPDQTKEKGSLVTAGASRLARRGGDGEATEDEVGSAGEPEDGVGWRTGGDDVQATQSDSNNLRKRARLRSLQQRKRNDDPGLFDIRVVLQAAERPGILMQAAGTLISGVCLHFHLLELSPALGEATAAVIEGTPAELEQSFSQTGLSFSIASIARHLPFEYYFKASAGLQRALESSAADSGGKL